MRVCSKVIQFVGYINVRWIHVLRSAFGMATGFTPEMRAALDAISTFKKQLGDVALNDVTDIPHDRLPWARELVNKFVRGVYFLL